MKKRKIIFGLAALCAAGVALGACGGEENVESIPTAPLNGGFETADLSGWSVEYGNAFDDDCVCSAKTFVFDNDVNHNELKIGATGNWYLSGKGFHGQYSGARTGAIRSTSFIIPSDGVISMKLAGGALNIGKGGGAKKDPAKICFVGVYRESDDKMIARQTNEYFVEHIEDYVNPNRYENGTYHTDNFAEYELDLSAYVGEKVYLRIVDNDDSYYYGYFAVDDIRIGYTDEQSEGEYFVKTKEYVREAESESEYEIVNGGFETGSLAGWTIVSGDAFSNDGVNAENVWWNENITYSRDGDYHYGLYRPSATGVMRSSEFVLGGAGYISYKLGGCSDQSKTYLRIMQKGEDRDVEIARLSNYKYWNFQFPHVANGMRLLNMVQYYVHLPDNIGATMYIEVVDNNDSSDPLGCITLDSIKTYWDKKPVWYDSESYAVVIESDIMPESEYQVTNGGFETGDLTGWTCTGNIGRVVEESYWLDQPYNKKGRHLFTGFEHDGQKLEGNTGTLVSSAFKVGGSGWITYLLGGGKNTALCYMSIIDAETDEELARFVNAQFNDGTMISYKADLGEFMGRSVKIKLTDNATSDWGLLVADSFVTYYKTASAVPNNANLAVDILSLDVLGEGSEYQVYNGDFEAGVLLGWTLSGNIGGISNDVIWRGWVENLSHNKDGEYFFNGWNGAENEKGTLTSEAFTVGGCGWITFKLGGGKNTALCRVQIIDADTGEVLAAYGNSKFHTSDEEFGQIVKGTLEEPADASEYNIYLANMVRFKADLSAFIGRRVKIRVVDNATSDWGLVFVDSFITYYETLDAIPADAETASDLIEH